MLHEGQTHVETHLSSELPASPSSVRHPHSFRIVTSVLRLSSSVLRQLELSALTQFTNLGRKFRAVSEDHETASAMGIDVNQVSRLALVIGSMK